MEQDLFGAHGGVSICLLSKMIIFYSSDDTIQALYTSQNPENQNFRAGTNVHTIRLIHPWYPILFSEYPRRGNDGNTYGKQAATSCITDRTTDFRLAWNLSSSSSAKIPAPNISQLSLLSQHGSIWSDVRYRRAERTEIRVAFNGRHPVHILG